MPADDHLGEQMHEWRGSHRPFHDIEGEPMARIHNMENIFPEDVYTHPHYYGADPRYTPGFHEAVHQLRKARGNPEAQIRVWRAVPREAPDVINEGDWVTTASEYARHHGMSNLQPGFKVLRITAPAEHVVTGQNDIMEWGYGGQSRPAMRVYQHRPTKRQRELGGWGD